MQDLGCRDPSFFLDNFYALPLTFLFESVDALQKQHKKRVNVESRPIAEVATAVYWSNGASDVSIDMFLPYQVDNEEKIKPQTCKTFLELLDDNLIPSKVLSAASKYLPTISKYDK